MSVIEVTGTHQRDAWARHELPMVEQVRPGLHSVPIPVGRGTVRYTNVYVFESGDGLTLIDAGWDNADAWAHLMGGLGGLGYVIGDVRRVLVTHAHRDHLGQAARIRRESGALIAMHPREARLFDQGDVALEVLREEMLGWLRRAGAPDDEAPQLFPMALSGDGFEIPTPDVYLEDGDTVDAAGWDLRAVWTPGHTPGHLSFHERSHGLLYSGDHLLPRISPNVSLRPRLSANPLGEFLASLDKLDGIDGVDEVLPAHEYRFRGLRDRVEQLRGHHQLRLREIWDVVHERGGCTAWEACSAVTWARSWNETPQTLRRLALGETLAHLVELEKRGHLARRAGTVETWLPGSSGRP